MAPTARECSGGRSEMCEGLKPGAGKSAASRIARSAKWAELAPGFC